MEDTIDITDLVESMRSSFVTWAIEFSFDAALATPGFTWIGAPIVSTLIRALIRWIANTLTKSAVMEAFFLNTAMRKSSQATDYVNAIKKKNSLPEDASEEEYAHAESEEIFAFNSFVRFTS